jgi:hypothetical protein
MNSLNTIDISPRSISPGTLPTESLSKTPITESLSPEEQKTQGVWKGIDKEDEHIGDESHLNERVNVLEEPGSLVTILHRTVGVSEMTSGTSPGYSLVPGASEDSSSQYSGDNAPWGESRRSLETNSKHVSFQGEDLAREGSNGAASEESARAVSSIGDIPPVDVCCNCSVS